MSKKYFIKLNILKISSVIILGIVLSENATAANWLMLQGAEQANAPKYRMFGFLQPQVTYHNPAKMSGLAGGAAANNGKVVGLNLVGPKLENETEFHFKRARIGWRGKLTGNINYFTLFEVANNALTYEPFGDRRMVIAPSDLSLTFNHIPGAKVRAGLFKNPGSEESFQGIISFDYIEFTDYQNRVNLERFSKSGKTLAGSPNQVSMGSATPKGYAFSAFRDWGIQVFDQKKYNQWDLSYAVKVGRGEALYHSLDPDFSPELYLYASGEYDLPGGKGPKKHGIKLYGWHQRGERSFDLDATKTKYDRIRQGVGVKALGKLVNLGSKQRISAEFMQANGMIFIAPQGNVPGGDLQYAAEKGNKARGYYLDVGFFPTKKWELGLRYDRNDLLYETASNVNVGNEREITGMTYAVSYYFKPKLKLSFNFIQRKAEAPEAYTSVPGTAFGDPQATTTTNNVKKIVSNLDDRYALQLSWFF